MKATIPCTTHFYKVEATKRLSSVLLPFPPHLFALGFADFKVQMDARRIFFFLLDKLPVFLSVSNWKKATVLYAK